MIRAAWSQAFRAPNIRELFGGLSQSNPAVADPCADFSRLDPVRIERCIDQGVPADGSPMLEPQDAETLTPGMSWQPRVPAELAVHLDYYDIDIRNGIGANCGTSPGKRREGGWEVGYAAHWIGAARERGGELFPGTVNRAGSVLYHDLLGRTGWLLARIRI